MAVTSERMSTTGGNWAKHLDEITIITEPMTDDPNRHNPKKHLFARQTYLPKFRQQEKSSAKLPSSRTCPAAEVGYWWTDTSWLHNFQALHHPVQSPYFIVMRLETYFNSEVTIWDEFQSLLMAMLQFPTNYCKHIMYGIVFPTFFPYSSTQNAQKLP